jgi:hypothetical protein
LVAEQTLDCPNQIFKQSVTFVCVGQMATFILSLGGILKDRIYFGVVLFVGIAIFAFRRMPKSPSSPLTFAGIFR